MRFLVAEARVKKIDSCPRHSLNAQLKAESIFINTIHTQAQAVYRGCVITKIVLDTFFEHLRAVLFYFLRALSNFCSFR